MPAKIGGAPGVAFVDPGTGRELGELRRRPQIKSSIMGFLITAVPKMIGEGK